MEEYIIRNNGLAFRILKKMNYGIINQFMLYPYDRWLYKDVICEIIIIV